MRRTILAAGFICALMFGAQDAVGQCMCAHGPGSRNLPAHEAFKSSEIVFTGEIVEVKKGTSSDEYSVNISGADQGSMLFVPPALLFAVVLDRYQSVVFQPSPRS